MGDVVEPETLELLGLLRMAALDPGGRQFSREPRRRDVLDDRLLRARAGEPPAGASAGEGGDAPGTARVAQVVDADARRSARASSSAGEVRVAAVAVDVGARSSWVHVGERDEAERAGCVLR